MTSFWWERFPKAAGHLSPAIGAILADGRYLAAWPRAGAWAPLGAIVLGVAFGALRLGSVNLFSYSLTMMAAMLLVGHLGAALGAWLTAGYAVGNIVLAPHAFGGSYRAPVLQRLVLTRAPALIACAVLAIAVAVIPLVSRRLGWRALGWRGLGWRGLARRPAAASTGSPARDGTRAAIATGIAAVIAALLTHAWVLVTPVLIRPIFTWPHVSTRVEAFRPLQHHGWVLVVLAALGVVGRYFLVTAAAKRPATARQPAATRTTTAAPPTPARASPGRVLVGIPFRAALATLLLSGLLVTWPEAVSLFSAFVLIGVVSGIVSRSGAWTRAVLRLPFLARAGLATVAAFVLGRAIVGLMWNHPHNFQPVLFAVVGSALVLAVLTPQPTAAAASTPRSPAPPSPARSPAGAVPSP